MFDKTIGIQYTDNEYGEHTMSRLEYKGDIWKGKNDQGEYCEYVWEQIARFDKVKQSWRRFK